MVTSAKSVEPVAERVGSPTASTANHATHSAGFGSAYAAALARTAPQGTTLPGTHGHAAGPSGGALPLSPVGSSSAGSRQVGAAHHGSPGHEFQARALGVLAYRQQVLASNIANADTPGYRAVDVDYREVLAGAGALGGLPMVVSAAGHIAGTPTPGRVEVKYRVPTQSSVDQNTVELDTERSAFAENAIRYEFALDQAISHYKHMMEMLKDLK